MRGIDWRRMQCEKEDGEFPRRLANGALHSTEGARHATTRKGFGSFEYVRIHVKLCNCYIAPPQHALYTSAEDSKLPRVLPHHTLQQATLEIGFFFLS